ncbi:prephenate dehydrogenase TyrA [Clostridium cylindrosporum DSM 605]|uniref:Prephenate dehydrogenase TyrA n=1 Tax=Clostridium cylindrosporum DSM 605 TaxID=1121307 RepID=A0A0J8DA49_CLOCY|nr:prephenate dehydrogenase TyrA [Clostridium cylindrosporum DSM 605]
MQDFRLNVCIVGLGLIGSSYARALKKFTKGKVIGLDISEETIKLAVEKNIIDEGYIDPGLALKNADIVILAVYPDLTEKFVIENMDIFKKGAVITDSAGIKGSIINTINKALRDDLDFVGGHPMAGKEGSGLENGCDSIFKGANYLITPTKRNREDSIVIVEDIARAIGCKNIVRISPEEHDRIIAYTSHLPHILAVALVNSDILNKDTSLFVAGSFRDATRVADINAGLWTELIMQNKEYVIEQLSIFESNIAELKNFIASGDNSSVYSKLEEARDKKRGIKIYV